MSSKASDVTLCLSSGNRDTRVYPEPNDFVLDLKARYDVQLISLGSLEFPYSQYVIEEDWNDFAFDVGLSLPSQAQRMLRFVEPQLQDLVVFPAPYTAVTYVSSWGDGSKALWRVGAAVLPVRAHGLVQRSLATLLPTVLVSPTESLPVLSVPSPDCVVTPLPPACVRVNFTGVLACTAAGVRTFYSAEHLCAVWNAYMSDPAVALPLRLSYEAAEAVLLLTVSAAGGGGPLLVEGAGVLQALNFPCAFGRAALASMRSTRFPNACGRQVPPGNYDFNVLRHQTELLLNPLAQFGSIAPASLTVYVYGQASSVAVALSPLLLYDPKAVALALTRQFDAALLPLELPSIRFDFVADAFQAACATPFRVFWGDSRLGAQLGFDGDLRLDVFHRGAARNYLALPTVVTAPSVFAGEATGQLKTLVFNARGRVQMSSGVAGVAQQAGLGPILAPIGSVPVEYLVAFAQSDGGYCWAVASHCAADAMPASPTPLPTNWNTVLTPLNACAEAGVLDGAVVPAYGGAVNLYFFVRPPASVSRLADIYGFRMGANPWPTPGAPPCCDPVALVAPGQVCLDQPPYILLEFGLEHMSATVTHRSGQDVKSQLFTKVPLHCPFRTERNIPMQSTSTGVTSISSLHVRIYNPDHTLYRFHGRNFSLTLTFSTTTQKAVRTECP